MTNNLYHYIDEPYNTKWNMATVINGPHKGKQGCIAIGFSCGQFILDLGIPNDYSNESILIYVRKEDLRFWNRVDSVKT